MANPMYLTSSILIKFLLKIVRKSLLIVLLAAGLACVFLPTQVQGQRTESQALPPPIQKSLSHLEQLYLAAQFDSLKEPLDVLAALIEEDSTQLSLYSYGDVKGQYHLYLGQYHGQRYELDSATYHFQKAMGYRAQYTNYQGWFEPMTFSVEYLLTKRAYEEYLDKLDKGYTELKSKNPEEAKKEYGMYLEKRFFPTVNPSEKLTILSEMDSILSSGSYQIDKQNALRFYTDVLEWCYAADQKDWIATYRPKYDDLVKTQGIGQAVQNYYEAVFSDKAKKTSAAIGYYTLVANDPQSSTNILGASYKALERLYLVSQDSAKAYLQFKNLIHLRDSINALNRYDEAAELQRKMEKQALKLQLTESELYNVQKNQFIMAILAILIAFGLFNLYLLERNKKKKNILKLKDAELNTTKSEARNKELMYVSKLALLEQMKNREKELKTGPASSLEKAAGTANSPEEDHDMEDGPDNIKAVNNGLSEVEEIPNYILDYLVNIPVNLTGRELKIITFMNQGFDNYDLEKIFSISSDAIRRAKWRIKKKINLDPDINLDEWARKIGR